MKKRTYQQACSLAVAMDMIGERWTWLIIRSLLTGSKRYGELLDQLPGIGTNLLADRMKSLSQNGLVEKQGRGRQAAYQLTAQGEALRPITHALIRWGLQFPEQIPTNATARPEWDMLAFEALFNPQKAGRKSAVLELTLSAYTFHLVIRKGQCRAVPGPAIQPDIQITSDTATLSAIGANALTKTKAKRQGLLKLQGDESVFQYLLDWFGE